MYGLCQPGESIKATKREYRIEAYTLLAHRSPISSYAPDNCFLQGSAYAMDRRYVVLLIEEAGKPLVISGIFASLTNPNNSISYRLLDNDAYPIKVFNTVEDLRSIKQVFLVDWEAKNPLQYTRKINRRKKQSKFVEGTRKILLNL